MTNIGGVSVSWYRIKHMFDIDVADLDAAETLAAAARLHAMQRQVDAQLLQLAAHYADLFRGRR